MRSLAVSGPYMRVNFEFDSKFYVKPEEGGEHRKDVISLADSCQHSPLHFGSAGGFSANYLDILLITNYNNLV